jgi:hypothetical protein
VITAASNYIEVGDMLQLTCTAIYSDGSMVDVTENVTWYCSETTIAVVTPTGLVAGVGEGTTQIVATLEGITGTFEVTVTPIPTISTATPTPTPQTKVTTVPWLMIIFIIALVLATALASLLLWRTFFQKKEKQP